MKTIKSKVNESFTWYINNKRELLQSEIEFIEHFSPIIYHNDLSCEHWAFDIKMPSGGWIENIKVNNELTYAKALADNIQRL